jgi:carbonic anhydrase/acetyltransferase-like protein (isoleucine patch superfamily)
MMRSFEGKVPKIHGTAFVHDSAEVIGDVVVGAGASVWPLCVLRGDIRRITIGERSNIQDSSVLHTTRERPAVVGPRVTVGHRAVLHGTRVGEGCLVGMGAVLLEADIGAWSLVGAGATVLSGLRVPAKSLVLGSPARVVRALSAEEIRKLGESAEKYVRFAEAHRKSSRLIFPE